MLIKQEDVITSSGKYKDRLKSNELTKEVKANIDALLLKVNALLTELKIEKVTISSGWRTSASNAAIPNAAKKSLHCAGSAIDIATHEVYDKIAKQPELLKKHGLWMEDKKDATTWTHLDQGTRSDRPVRIFRA